MLHGLSCRFAVKYGPFRDARRPVSPPQTAVYTTCCMPGGCKTRAARCCGRGNAAASAWRQKQATWWRHDTEKPCPALHKAGTWHENQRLRLAGRRKRNAPGHGMAAVSAASPPAAAQANKDGSEGYGLAGALVLRRKADAEQRGHRCGHLIVVILARGEHALGRHTGPESHEPCLV